MESQPRVPGDHRRSLRNVTSLMPKRFTLRTLVLVVTIFCVLSALAVAPSNRAKHFVNAFDGQVDIRKLHWLNEGERSPIHAKTAKLGLVPTNCAFYRAELQPMSIVDFFGFRRRVRLMHHGSWDFDTARDQASGKTLLVDYFKGNLTVDLVIGPFKTSVRQ